jgi:hyaluronoglucosaminidase
MSVSSRFRLGIVEGFFGRQWSWQARRDVASFLAAQGCNSYIYAPKNDEYLRKQWQVPCPGEHLLHLQKLSRHVQERGLDFGIGLSPFELYRDFSSTNRALLQNKIAQINSIAPQTLCILFDDMMGDLQNLATVQLEIVDFICSLSNAHSFVVCPTYYSDDPLLTRHFGEQPEHYLEDIGKGLDSSIDIFWTGPKVISSSYPQAHLLEVAARLQRKPLLWDNYPVNDAKRLTAFLHLKAFSGRDKSLRELTSGHLVNPMNEAYLSQIPLFSLAAIYSHAEYDAEQIFQNACNALCGPELAAALIEDVEHFQTGGLEVLTPAGKTALLRKYSQFLPDPMAQEIFAWLSGEYVFDPACLT